MTRSNRGNLQSHRKEFFELVDALVQASAVLLADAREQDQERFTKDLDAVHTFSNRLRQMGQELFALDLSEAAGNDEIEKTLRHDMLNALNVIINYCEEWIEDSEEEFLEGFLPDLKQLHTHGKQCLALLNRIRAIRLGEVEGAAATEQGAAAPVDPLFAIEMTQLEPTLAAEPGYCLVVDDNPQNRDILSRLLLRQGHRVESAVNGREALEKIQASSFDMVFLDIMMPEMNGFQVLEHLKTDEKLRGLPVVMISALGETDVVAHCISLGAEDYLPKPFNPVLLKARIGACLEKKRFRDRERLYLRQIEQEKKLSDQLLHVILPGPIVDELKTTNEVRPRRYDNVAVLFADLVGFTSYCDSHSAEEVVQPLQNLVKAWENCALKYGVEKIKTIGDAFMAAAGLLNAQENPVLSCVRCGLDMIAATQTLPGVEWNLRVGIDIGPVVAGVIGQRQYLFDLWGDTVNTAARMESNGVKGKITLTERAWQRIDSMARGERGEVDPKGKGKMTVYRLAELVSS
jgi:class 3 adenylate cyclase